jgi:hypothetical protein
MSDTCQKKMGNTLYLLLGFGGTGGKVIAQLAELATNDPVAAELIRERVHVVLCDTDVGELCESHDKVLSAFKSRVPGGAPPIETFDLGSGSDIFQDLVQERLRAAQQSAKGEDGLRAFQEHWWFDAGGQPFSAHRMPMAISAGAGQCPMVSHFLAWDGLARFESLLQEIADRAMNDRGMEGFLVELFLVSSLAGGTGRGCWQLLSLKAREFFGARRQACRPTGFFVDGSAFGDLMKNRPDQRIKLEVNSLTGLSELAMWLRDPVDVEKRTVLPERKFILPNLAKPGDEQVAAINTERFMPEAEIARRGRNPVHRAYLFTSRSDSVFLETKDDVFRACAASLYGKLTMFATRSSDANSPARAAATATNVLYVPVSDIRQAFRTSARAARAGRFLEGRTEVYSEGRKEKVPMCRVFREPGRVDRFIPTPATDVHARLEEFVAWFSKAFTIPKPEDLEMGSRKSEGRLQSVAEHLSESLNEDRESRFESANLLLSEAAKAGAGEREVYLRDGIQSGGGLGSAESFQRAVRKILDLPQEPNAENVEAVLWRVLVDVGLPSGAQRSRLSLSAFAGRYPGSGSPFMLAHVLERLDADLFKKLETLRTCRSEFEEQRKDGARGIDAIISQFEEGLRLWARIPLMNLFLPPFSRRTVESLQELIFREQVDRCYMEILDQYRDLLESLRERLIGLKSRSDALLASVLRLQERHESTAEEQRKKCFTMVGGSDSVGRELKVLQEENLNPVSRIIRKLRPVFQRKQFDEAVEKAIDLQETQASEESGWLGRLAQPGDSHGLNLFGGALGGTLEVSQFKHRAASELEAILERQSMDDSALEREFHIAKSMEGFLAYWITAYLATGNPNDQLQISKAVEGAIGINLQRLDAACRTESEKSGGRFEERMQVPESTRILAEASLHLAQKCDPLVQFGQGGRSRGDTVTVSLPKLQDDDAAKTVTNLIRLGGRNLKEQLDHVQVDAKSRNPYMLVVSTEAPKGDFDERGWAGWESLNYWRRDPDVKRWLLMAEQHSGASVFCHEDDSIGLGYLSPQYVRNPYFSNRRWKPWVEAWQSDRKWRALAYALVGNDPYRSDKSAAKMPEAPWFKRYKQFRDVVSGLLLNRNHPGERLVMPLLLEAPGGNGPCFQRRLLTRDTGGGFRLLGEDLGPSAGHTYQFRSMRSFIDWFCSTSGNERDDRKSSDDVFDAIGGECEMLAELMRNPEFLGDPDTLEMVHAIRSPETLKAVNEFVREYVREWLEYSDRNISREEDRQRQREFLEEFNRVVQARDFHVLGGLGAESVVG